MSVRIGIDARPLIYPGTGNARYLHGMLTELVRLRPEIEWQLFSHRPLHADFLGLIRLPNVSLDASASGLMKLGPLWVHLALPRLVSAYGCDLFWAALPMLPLFARRRVPVPKAVNFHDMNVFVAADTMEKWVRLQQRMLTGHIVANADRILCLSKTTREDLMHFYPSLPAERAVVVYPGCELPVVVPRAPQGSACGEGFFLTVGSIEPRKNQETLINAYLVAREQHALPPLVVLGRRGWGAERLYERLSSGSLSDRGIIYLENQPDSVLRWCYERASVVAFPSLHEGFGLPVVEALQLGKPVLVSDIPVFREAAPEARFVPPLSVDAWAGALRSAAADVKTGALRAPRLSTEEWSWHHRASELLAVFEGLLS